MLETLHPHVDAGRRTSFLDLRDEIRRKVQFLFGYRAVWVHRANPQHVGRNAQQATDPERSAVCDPSHPAMSLSNVARRDHVERWVLTAYVVLARPARMFFFAFTRASLNAMRI